MSKKEKNNKSKISAQGRDTGVESVYTKAELHAEARDRRRAWVITLTLFTGVMIAFMFLGFRTPLPLPEEKGIDVVIGTVEYGDQPEPERAEEIPEEPVEDAEPTPQEAAEPESTPVEAPRDVATTEDAQAPEVNTRSEPETQTPEEEKPKEEKKEKVEAKEEPIPKEKAKPKVDPNALYTGKNKTKGEEGKPGDKGKQEGNEDSDSFEKIGESDAGTGISFNLAGRAMRNPPKINDNSQKYGKVVVEIVVDQDGDVIRAVAGKRGSTTTDQGLLVKAREAALKTKFSPNASAPDEQIGTMIFNFRLR